MTRREFIAGAGLAALPPSARRRPAGAKVGGRGIMSGFAAPKLERVPSGRYSR